MMLVLIFEWFVWVLLFGSMDSFQDRRISKTMPENPESGI